MLLVKNHVSQDCFDEAKIQTFLQLWTPPRTNSGWHPHKLANTKQLKLILEDIKVDAFPGFMDRKSTSLLPHFPGFPRESMFLLGHLKADAHSIIILGDIADGAQGRVATEGCKCLNQGQELL